jgi:hypothetical protein
MVVVELASNPKIGRLSDAEFRCLVSGVWPLAAKASPRGALRVASLPAEPADVAHQARQSETVARKTLDKLRALGMVEHDPELGCEVVHDWDEINPGPKASDTPEATRERKRRERERRGGHANVTRDNGVSHAGEVEVEGKPPVAPVTGGTDDLGWAEWLEHHRQLTGLELPAPKTKAHKAMTAAFRQRRQESYSLDDLKLATVGAWNDPYRRENGYYTPDSILRPTKVAALIAKGKLAARTPGPNRPRRDTTDEDLEASRR